MTYIVSLSPKGQITIPVAERKHCAYHKYLLEVKNKTIILKPIEIKVIEVSDDPDEMKHFSGLAETSFDFWENQDDDIYQEFYSKNKAL